MFEIRINQELLIEALKQDSHELVTFRAKCITFFDDNFGKPNYFLIARPPELLATDSFRLQAINRELADDMSVSLSGTLSSTEFNNDKSLAYASTARLFAVVAIGNSGRFSLSLDSVRGQLKETQPLQKHDQLTIDQSSHESFEIVETNLVHSLEHISHLTGGMGSMRTYFTDLIKARFNGDLAKLRCQEWWRSVDGTESPSQFAVPIATVKSTNEVLLVSTKYLSDQFGLARSAAISDRTSGRLQEATFAGANTQAGNCNPYEIKKEEEEMEPAF